jgi:hypothetical protein
VKFSSLKKILSYCEENKIPAIMIIHSTVKSEWHAVIFTKYYPQEGLIRIKDPGNSWRTSISFDELRYSFSEQRSKDDAGYGRYIILASDKMINKRYLSCMNCKKVNIVDNQIADAIKGVLCTDCDRFIPVQ